MCAPRSTSESSIYAARACRADLIQARAWLEKAAAGGDPQALYTLGRALSESAGQAVADPVRAADLYRRAAEKGHALAGLRYGLALSEGNGVKRDPVAAQRWLMQAQESGIPEAALALGDMAARTPASRDKAANEKIVQSALSWYQAAANAGVPSAQFKLANAYFAGVGVPRDPAQALLWYGRAAQQGLPQAQHALGIMLIGGVAGTADPVEGYKWLLLAEKGGHPEFPRRPGKGGGADCRSATASAPRRWRSASSPTLRTSDRRRSGRARQSAEDPVQPLSRP